MRTGEIRALTGLRIVAAVWVVLFHFRPLLEQAAPGFRSALAPVLDCGAQGVDLFFILSGFVLIWNYLYRMGESWSWRSMLHFLWLRLSRVWPVYLVTMHLAALWIIFTLNVGHVPSEAANTLTATNYVRQFLLVQLWFAPYFDGTSWDGPAWSISAEWLAYILFGVLVLVIFRIARATRARGLIYLAVAASLPPVVYLGHISFSLYMVHELVHTTWNWMVMQFELRLGSDLAGKAVLVGLIAVAFVGAVLLYHLVEEPARHWMRGMMKSPRDARADRGHGKLQTIDRQRGEPTPVVSVRAG